VDEEEFSGMQRMKLGSLPTNRLFLGAVVQSLPFRGDTVGAIFTRSIVQFFNDSSQGLCHS
jgi:hypothetical protein